MHTSIQLVAVLALLSILWPSNSLSSAAQWHIVRRPIFNGQPQIMPNVGRNIDRLPLQFHHPLQPRLRNPTFRSSSPYPTTSSISHFRPIFQKPLFRSSSSAYLNSQNRPIFRRRVLPSFSHYPSSHPNNGIRSIFRNPLVPSYSPYPSLNSNHRFRPISRHTSFHSYLPHKVSNSNNHFRKMIQKPMLPSYASPRLTSHYRPMFRNPSFHSHAPHPSTYSNNRFHPTVRTPLFNSHPPHSSSYLNTHFHPMSRYPLFSSSVPSTSPFLNSRFPSQNTISRQVRLPAEYITPLAKNMTRTIRIPSRKQIPTPSSSLSQLGITLPEGKSPPVGEYVIVVNKDKEPMWIKLNRPSPKTPAFKPVVSLVSPMELQGQAMEFQ